MRAQGYGAECEHGRLARKCERCADADEMASLRDCAKQYEQWLTENAATIADLRDRLRMLSPMVCEGCGCAIVARDGRCEDCETAHAYRHSGSPAELPVRIGACVSVGLRALCGRRLLDGCDTTKGGE